MIEAWERLLEWGGTKRDVVFLIDSVTNEPFGAF